MRYYLTFTVSLLLCFAALVPNPVSARSGSHTLSITTGEIDIVGGVKVEISYDVPVRIHHPETMVPGEQVEWAISVSTGEIDLRVYVPFPLNAWYSVTKKPVPIGMGVDIEVPVPTPGASIIARVKTHMTASLTLDGPGTLDRSTLTWVSDGSQVFNVRANSGSEHQQIQVIVDGNIGLSLSLVIDIIGLFELEIGLTDLGIFDFQRLTQNMDIVPDWRILEQQIADLETQITTLERQVNTLETEKTTLADEKAALEDQVTNLAEQIANLEQRVVDFEEQIGSSEGKPPWSFVYVLLFANAIALAVIVYLWRKQTDYANFTPIQ